MATTTADGCHFARRSPPWSMHACNRSGNSAQRLATLYSALIARTQEKSRGMATPCILLSALLPRVGIRAHEHEGPRAFCLQQAQRGITFRCVPCTTQPWRAMRLTLSHGNCADGCGLMGGHGGYGPALTPREPKNVSMPPIQIVRGNYSQSDQTGNQSSYNMKCPSSEMRG